MKNEELPAILTKAVLSGRVSTKENIQPKPRTCRGTVYAPTNDKGAVFNADIANNRIVNNLIRIHGVYANHVNGPQKFSLYFQLGDVAVFDSFNLVYTGEIVKIAPKSVTIFDKCSQRNKRLDLFDFIQRNWNFNLEKINKRNSEWMD